MAIAVVQRVINNMEEKVKFCGIFRDQFTEKLADFVGISREFRGKLHQKAISKKRPILWLFSRQISLESDRFCTDQTSIFNVFLTEVIICSFNNNTPQKWTNGKALLTSWLVPSFSQHNLHLVVSGRCLHVSVTKFQDKFASFRQVNSPYSWNKFQICCTDMYLIRFLPNFCGIFHVFVNFAGFSGVEFRCREVAVSRGLSVSKTWEAYIHVIP